MSLKKILAAAAGAAFLALLVFGITGCSSSTTPPGGRHLAYVHVDEL